MTKDWTIIRAVLIALESSATPNTVVRPKDLPFAEQEVAYNIRLLSEAGYINANILESRTGDGAINAAIARSLTNAGHELLDTIRSDMVWKKTVDTFKTRGLDMTFDLVMTVGKKIMETMLAS